MGGRWGLVAALLCLSLCHCGYAARCLQQPGLMGGRWGLVAALLCLSLCHCGYAARCLQQPEVNPKRYMKLADYGDKRLPITLDVSRRLTHQITSYIFKIFLDEELGYPDVVIKENNDRSNQTGQIRQRMSGPDKDQGINSTNPPETTLNTEVWMSPEADSVSWFEQHHLKQCGPIGPPARFGWFIPKVLLNNQDVVPFWKTFASPDTAKLFTLVESEMNFLRTYTKGEDSRYFCEEEFCNNGMHTPLQCNGLDCAVLIAGYADTTEFVVTHIKRLSLLVRVVWVGPHLANVVSTLTTRLASSKRLLVFLSYTPSALVPPEDQSFSTVAFPPCEEFALDTGCKYDLHSLVKLYSTIIEKGAQPAYEAYLKMSFNQTEYKHLIVKYKSALFHTRNRTEAVIQAACEWLQENPSARSLWKTSAINNNFLYIGGIFPMTNQRSVATNDVISIVKAAQKAQIDVNRNDSVLRDYTLKLLVDNGHCEADYVLKAFIETIVNQKYKQLVGILGPACSNTLEPLAGVSHHYRTIVISYSAEGSSFSNRNKYPYFFRTIGENNQYQQVYMQLLAKLNWRRLAALTEDGQKYTEYLSHLQDLLTSNNYTFVMNRKFPTVRDNNAMKSYLEEMKSKTVRIIIGDVYDDTAREMMCQAYQLQMTARQSYVWFLPGWLTPDWYDTDRYNRELDAAQKVPCSTHQMLEAINGHLSLNHAAWAPDDAVMQTKQTVGQWRRDFLQQLNQSNNRTSKLPASHTRPKHTSISSYAGYAYDAVWMYALALEQLIREDPSALASIHGPKTTERYVQILEKTDFNGVSGRIQFRGNPSRTSVVEVLQWVNNVTHIVGTFEPNVSVYNKDPLAGTLHLNESAIVWLNPDKTKPKDGTVRCFLGLAEYFGVDDCNLFLAISNIIGFCVLGVIIIIGFLVIKSRYDKKVKMTQQKIRNYMGFDLLNVETLEKWEIPRDKVVINRKLGEGAFGYVYGGEANFDSKGWVAVAVKTLKLGSTPEEKLEFLCEAEVMKRFDHKNIVQLLGVCTKNEPVYTVMEFMLYGDLKTFLLARRHLVNEKMGEDSEISSKKLTDMALDIARALSYLAELKFVHRDVASRNCLVNTARVVKLGDFGMTRPMFDKDYYKFTRRGMLPVRWMSPESLAEGLFTPASDVWSYGVLLYEIITFGSFPFQGMSNNQVLEHVKAGNTLPIPSGVRPQAVGLIRSCWTLDYKKRPKITEIFGFISNNPRLLTPCLDVPLASVQTDDSGSVDLLPPGRLRRFSFSLRNRNGSGVFNNSSSQWGYNSNGIGTPNLWSQEEPEPENPGQLFPVGEEDPEWDRPLLNAADKYDLVPSPRAVEFSAFDSPQATSLL